LLRRLNNTNKSNHKKWVSNRKRNIVGAMLPMKPLLRWINTWGWVWEGCGDTPKGFSRSNSLFIAIYFCSLNCFQFTIEIEIARTKSSYNKNSFYKILLLLFILKVKYIFFFFWICWFRELVFHPLPITCFHSQKRFILF
jgi:hypothetical protein